MTSLEISTNIRTLGDCFNAMAPFAGGTVPTGSDLTNWTNWIVDKQEEYARRGFWRRCLTRYEDTVLGDTYVLPDRFNRPNALFMFIVDGVDWNENANSDEQSLLVEMINDIEDEDFGKWQVRLLNEVTEQKDLILWYYSNPPKPVSTTDILLLPGDMLAYAGLGQYFRQQNQSGSQDDAEQAAENRFQEYLSLEAIPDKSQLLQFSEGEVHIDRLKKARGYYANRTGRNYQA